MAERYRPPQRNRGLSRREFVAWGAAGATLLVGGYLGYMYEKVKNRGGNTATSPPLPLGVTGEFVDLKEGDTVSGDIFTFGVDEQIRVPGTVLEALEATMWYAGAIPDTSENPQGGWVRASILDLNTQQSGIRRFNINMAQPKPDETPVPDGQFSLSVNAKGRRPDGKPGVTEGVPGPIKLMYRRTLVGS